MSKYEQLKALAEKADLGIRPNHVTSADAYIKQIKINESFISAANPNVVLEMIAEIESITENLRIAEEALENIGSPIKFCAYDEGHRIKEYARETLAKIRGEK